MPRLRLEINPTSVTDGPHAYTKDKEFDWKGNIGEAFVPASDDIQSIMMILSANVLNAKVDYELYDDNSFKKKGTAKMYQLPTGALEIRFFLKTSKK